MFVNKSALKQYIKERIKSRRPALKTTQISEETYLAIEAQIRLFIDKEIDKHPTVGKTFRIPTT